MNGIAVERVVEAVVEALKRVAGERVFIHWSIRRLEIGAPGTELGASIQFPV